MEEMPGRYFLKNYNFTRSKEMLFIRVLIAMASADTKSTFLYYGTDDGTTLGAHLTLNLNFVTQLDEDFTSENLINAISEWVDYTTPLKYTANWLVGVYKPSPSIAIKTQSFSDRQSQLP